MTQLVSRRPVAASNFGITLFSRVFNALELYRQHKALAKMDVHQLDDLGLTQADIARELRKPIWV